MGAIAQNILSIPHSGPFHLGKNDEHNSLLRSARVVSLATLLSRILGCVRDVVTMAIFPPWARDSIIWAWTIPNIFRRLLGEGALSSALIPRFALLQKTEGLKPALAMGMGVLRGLSIILFLLLSLIYLGTWLLPDSIWESLASNSEDLDRGLKTSVTRILLWIFLPYLFLVCLMAQISGLLNALGRFFVPAVLPALLNAFWILGAVAVSLTSWETRTKVETLAVFILLGGVTQLVLSWIDLKRMTPLPKPSPVIHPEVVKVFVLMSPLLVGLAASQINVFVDRIIATTRVPGSGAVSSLYNGLRITQLSMGLTGIAVSTVAFPRFSQLAAGGEHSKLGDVLFASIRSGLFLAIPGALGGIALAYPIFECLFEYGEFTAADTLRSGQSLMGYSVGVPFMITSMMLIKAAYSMQRYRMTVWVTLAAVAVNVTLSLALVGPLGEVGIALATSASAAVQTGLLLPTYVAYNRTAALACFKDLALTTAVSLLMGWVCWAIVTLLPFPDGRVFVMLRLGLAILGGVVFFFVVTKRLLPDRVSEFSTLIRRRR